MERLREATERNDGPRLSQTAIVERGIELALQELGDADVLSTRRTKRK
jgi:hypothetical protein